MTTHKVRLVSLDTYKKNVIKMLRRDFKLRIADAEEEHFAELKNEIQVDNFVRKLINDKL